MALGDSFTEGVGADNDSTYPKQLSYLLQDSFDQPLEVWNCGFSSSDPVYQFRLFKDKLLKYDPDMIIAELNSNALRNIIARGGFERFMPNMKVRYKSPPWFEPLYGESFIVRRVVHDVFKYNWQLLSPKEMLKEEALANKIVINVIDSFALLCSQQNIKLLVVTHPLLHAFPTEYYKQLTFLIDHCNSKQIARVDVCEEFKRMGIDSLSEALYYWPIDGHFNNRGYHYMAKGMLQKVAEELDSAKQPLSLIHQ
jgi:lysophospholipase L1-like esterase